MFSVWAEAPPLTRITTSMTTQDDSSIAAAAQHVTQRMANAQFRPSPEQVGQAVGSPIHGCFVGSCAEQEASWCGLPEMRLLHHMQRYRGISTFDELHKTGGIANPVLQNKAPLHAHPDRPLRWKCKKPRCHPDKGEEAGMCV